MKIRESGTQDSVRVDRPAGRMTVDIRVGQQEDVKALAPLWGEMVEHHRALLGQTWPIRQARQAWSIRQRQYFEWIRDGTGLLQLAINRLNPGAPVGYVVSRLREPGPIFDLGTCTADVEDLSVTSSARGAGVGTALLAANREKLRSLGVSYWSIGVAEANVEAIALYERLGFRPLNRRLLSHIEDKND